MGLALILLCLFLGHRWFRTVGTEVPYTSWSNDFPPYGINLGYFHERICTRCGKDESNLIEDVKIWHGDAYQPYAPDWAIEEEVEHILNLSGYAPPKGTTVSGRVSSVRPNMQNIPRGKTR